MTASVNEKARAAARANESPKDQVVDQKRPTEELKHEAEFHATIIPGDNQSVIPSKETDAKRRKIERFQRRLELLIQTLWEDPPDIPPESETQLTLGLEYFNPPNDARRISITLEEQALNEPDPERKRQLHAILNEMIYSP